MRGIKFKVEDKCPKCETCKWEKEGECKGTPKTCTAFRTWFREAWEEIRQVLRGE